MGFAVTQKWLRGSFVANPNSTTFFKRPMGVFFNILAKRQAF